LFAKSFFLLSPLPPAGERVRVRRGKKKLLAIAITAGPVGQAGRPLRLLIAWRKN
jgi:hypothetical protein